ncbi:MAG: cytochrome c maturation protein CcmE [Microscillaceae bacterium]|nr:cytochrome c maturation protein CcmE [Microscillaceae bacterium]
MKKSYIFGIVVIAIAVSMLVATVGDASQYVNFDQAFQMAQNGNTTKIHVVGQLKKDPKGKILEVSYNPEKNPNLFTFTLVDANKRAETVVYRSPKPADFERSEQVVVVGNVQNGKFVAEKILMKCPSKYQETELKEAKKAETI